MDIKGKILLFPERKADKDGKAFIKLSTSVSSKDADGNNIYKSMDVHLDRKNFPEEKVNSLDPDSYYVLDVSEGWLQVRVFVNKQGVRETAFCAFVKSGSMVDKKAKGAKTEKPNIW